MGQCGLKYEPTKSEKTKENTPSSLPIHTGHILGIKRFFLFFLSFLSFFTSFLDWKMGEFVLVAMTL